MSNLRYYPLGDGISGSPHSALLSLPSMDDVLGYCEKRPETMAAVTSGYPRFVVHPYVRQVAAELQQRLGLKGRTVLPVSSETAVVYVSDFVRTPSYDVAELDGALAILLPYGPELQQQGRAFLQHTGFGMSSRQAERWLVRQGLRPAPHPESRSDAADPWDELRGQLAPWFNVPRGEVRLYPNGMNAVWNAFHAMHTVQVRMSGERRERWIQLGWLYLDTMRLLDVRALGGPEPLRVFHAGDIQGLRALLQREGHTIAGIVTEAPTNPLMQLPDLAVLRELADQYGALLLIDPSTVGPAAIDVLPYADVVTVSLTKYTAYAGDVLAGACVVNPKSRQYAHISAELGVGAEPLQEEDARRLAAEVPGCEARVRLAGENARRLAEALRKHPRVRNVFWTGSIAYGRNWDRFRRGDIPAGPMLSFTLKNGASDFYDRVRLAKSPSFGTLWTMLCPYLYLAHYDLVKSAEGRTQLRLLGLDAELMRLAVGTEPVEQIWEVIEAALR